MTDTTARGAGPALRQNVCLSTRVVVCCAEVRDLSREATGMLRIIAFTASALGILLILPAVEQFRSIE